MNLPSSKQRSLSIKPFMVGFLSVLLAACIFYGLQIFMERFMLVKEYRALRVEVENSGAARQEADMVLNELEENYKSKQKASALIDLELQRLLRRYVEIKGDSSETLEEMVRLDDKFGELGFAVENRHAPTADDLITALQHLRTDMGQAAVQELKEIIEARSESFNAMLREQAAEREMRKRGWD